MKIETKAEVVSVNEDGTMTLLVKSNEKPARKRSIKHKTYSFAIPQSECKAMEKFLSSFNDEEQMTRELLSMIKEYIVFTALKKLSFFSEEERQAKYEAWLKENPPKPVSGSCRLSLPQNEKSQFAVYVSPSPTKNK